VSTNTPRQPIGVCEMAHAKALPAIASRAAALEIARLPD
jgi:hypothetical protein